MRSVLMATLLGGSLIGATLCAPAHADSAYGSMSVRSAVIQPGCHTYGYSYVIHPPANTDWSFIVMVTDPNGTNVGAQLWASGADSESGTGGFQLCSSQTPPGTYTLTGELDFSNGSQLAPTQVFLTPARFTLSGPSTAAPKRHKHKHHRKHRHHHRPAAAASLPAI